MSPPLDRLLKQSGIQLVLEDHQNQTILKDPSETELFQLPGNTPPYSLIQELMDLEKILSGKVELQKGIYHVRDLFETGRRSIDVDR